LSRIPGIGLPRIPGRRGKAILPLIARRALRLNHHNEMLGACVTFSRDPRCFAPLTAANVLRAAADPRASTRI
jgi:hypothetical protein